MAKGKRNNQSISPRQSPQEIHAAAYYGPIPDAGQIERYEQICSGSADRIIAMAEKQALHRQSIESKTVSSNARNATLGVVFAFLLGVLTIIGGVFLVYNGHEWSGAFLGSAGLVGLTTVFIYGTRSNRKERLEKNGQRLF